MINGRPQGEGGHPHNVICAHLRRTRGITQTKTPFHRWRLPRMLPWKRSSITEQIWIPSDSLFVSPLDIAKPHTLNLSIQNLN